MANETITITQSLDQVTVVSEGPVGLNSGGTISGPLTDGVDGTGHDVKFFGDTAGKYMQWDQSADKLFVNGEIEVNGTATTFNSTVITIDDPIFTLGGQQRTDALDDSKDRGIEFFYHDGAQKTGFMGYDDSADAFTFLTSATNSNEVFSGTAILISSRVPAVRSSSMGPRRLTSAQTISDSASLSMAWSARLTLVCPVIRFAMVILAARSLLEQVQQVARHSPFPLTQTRGCIGQVPMR